MKPPSDYNRKNALEWTVFGIGCLLIAATLGCLAWHGVNSKEGPALLLIETGSPVVEGGRVRVPVTVTNSGQRVASNVQILITGSSAGTKREAELTLDFVPRGASRHASVSFNGGEIPSHLKCEVSGYEEP